MKRCFWISCGSRKRIKVTEGIPLVAGHFGEQTVGMGLALTKKYPAGRFGITAGFQEPSFLRFFAHGVHRQSEYP
jgi:hypothetical protein